ncbi:MAG: WD40 repeat domain-containing protein [Deltaproteobacteria bacterium]|nr:WD40 repeat domain-containing protein [Deltaproteobacteria bacterium]MBN2672383.1 WD40 repeat domain-containing protein [Deltaproteobacteria bacterium]
MNVSVRALLILLWSACVAVYSKGATGAEPLLSETGEPSEAVVEALLYPGEFGHKQFVYISEGDEARYCLDSSLSAEEPFAQVYPERIVWPQIGGVDIRVKSLDLKLVPESDGVTDDALDKGFAIRWFLEADGQDFSNAPVFLLRAVGAEVFSTETAQVLMHWQKPAREKICKEAEEGFPSCDVADVPLSTQAVAVDPLGDSVAIATTGRKPGIAMYRITGTPQKKWQVLFPEQSGGARDVRFSSDGEYVVALLGNGEIHRFDARTGGRHLSIPSKGMVAHAVPPGDIIAVGGQSGEIVLWRLADGTIEWKVDPKQFRGDIDRMAVSGDGKRIATLEYSENETVIRVYRIHEKQAVAQLNLPGTLYADLALDYTGKTLVLSHEEKGLMKADISSKKPPVAVGNDAASCTEELYWAPKQRGPSCSVSGGILFLTEEGKIQMKRRIHSEATRWMMDQSPSGITVAVGAGHLLLWR